jgi:hypothetical protein
VQVSSSMTTVFIRGLRALYGAALTFIRPPGPEPGYHPPDRHGDVVGASIVFGLGAAALVVMVRVLGRIYRDRLHRQ